jgi:hypothetical protein
MLTMYPEMRRRVVRLLGEFGGGPRNTGYTDSTRFRLGRSFAGVCLGSDRVTFEVMTWNDVSGSSTSSSSQAHRGRLTLAHRGRTR